MPSMRDDLCSTSKQSGLRKNTWVSRNVSPCSDMDQKNQSNQMLGISGKGIWNPEGDNKFRK